MTWTRWIIAGVLLSAGSLALAQETRLVEVESGYQMLHGERPVLQYNTRVTERGTTQESYYRRSGYIHPLFSPSGKVLTEDYAPDHPHQHGLFFAWTKSTFQGAPHEFWNEKKELGKVEFAGEFSPEPEGFRSTQQFLSLTHPTDGEPTPVLLETWDVTPVALEADRFVIDLTSTQRCATDDLLTVEKYHYGGMAIRGHLQWTEGNCTIQTSEGLDRIEGNHTRPRWVVMSGEIDGETCGVAVLAHPDNFRFPQWVRLHPKMPYFVYSPMVEEPFMIEPGEDYVSRFRYVTFDGEPDLEQIEALWVDFAE